MKLPEIDETALPKPLLELVEASPLPNRPKGAPNAALGLRLVSLCTLVILFHLAPPLLQAAIVVGGIRMLVSVLDDLRRG